MAKLNTYSTQIELDVRDEQLLELIAAGTPVERIAYSFVFTEGPAWDVTTESLIFSDIIGNTMYRWSRHAGLSVFRQPSNMANGNTFDRENRLLTCEHATSRVTRTQPDGTIAILASHYDGKELNSPNDIVVHESGAIYFTDPLSGRTATYGVERPGQLGFQGVYRIDPETYARTLLADDFVLPNGLCFSLDERHLFVNDTRRGHIRVFDVLANGTLRGGSVWATPGSTNAGAPDGMKIDQAGNVWCTGPGGIHVFDGEAVCLGVIRVPERVANFAWGEADRRTLFIAASTSVYVIQTKVAGHETVA